MSSSPKKTPQASRQFFESIGISFEREHLAANPAAIHSAIDREALGPEVPS